nr:MAG TPA_asm: hypothetical protein [Caudoviricetes sp.]
MVKLIGRLIYNQQVYLANFVYFAILTTIN